MPTYYLNGPAGLTSLSVKLLSSTDPTTTIATITPTEAPAGVYSFDSTATGTVLVQFLSGSDVAGAWLEVFGSTDKWIGATSLVGASQPFYDVAKSGDAMDVSAQSRNEIAAATAEATGQQPIFEGTLTAVVNGTNAEFGGTLSDEGRATVNAYRLAVLRVFSGSHPAIEYQIQSYVPSTGVFRVSRAWLVAPSVGDVVQVFARLTPAINGNGEVTQNQSQSDVWFRTFITARNGNTITLANGPGSDASIVNQLVRVHSGPVENRGFTSSITAYDVPTRVATLADPLPADPLGNFQDSIAIAFAKVLGAPTAQQVAQQVWAAEDKEITGTVQLDVDQPFYAPAKTQNVVLALQNPLVENDGTLRLHQADDYSHTDTRSLEFTVNASVPGLASAGWRLHLTTGGEPVTVTGQYVSSGPHKVRFEPTKSQMQSLVGEGKWEIETIPQGTTRNNTLLRGRLFVTEQIA
jgi:hypothetical protein